MRSILFGIVALAMTSAAAVAQGSIPACPEQQQLEQVLGSNGDIMPEGCRNVNISVLESDGDRLCMVDLSGSGEGVVEQLREAAVDQRWWMRCQDVEEAMR
ncbi:hypothetical protein [Chelativorans sp. M5D2P16]|uniref:hypothetical protein n=1 Tax=Chelativorans sp. M5D2P16 TaxID=3095678 RepID=UPI002ACACAA2|nr:hypothetical protein [Chelativorans sp. M5D2P16]MDZ5697549.1 hypothetical protein [Chelativorans sp. M5D2P16]